MGGQHAVSIHPSVDNGIKPGAKDFAGGDLVCKCTQNPVKVSVTAQTAHNHACGCTKCWKPKGATVLGGCGGVARQGQRDQERGQAQGRRSRRRPSSVTPARAAACTCTDASRTPSTRFTDSISSTPNCRRKPGWSAPEFAAFVSSIIETGADPANMGAVRSRLKEIGLEPYDCLSSAADGCDRDARCQGFRCSEELSRGGLK